MEEAKKNNPKPVIIAVIAVVVLVAVFGLTKVGKKGGNEGVKEGGVFSSVKDAIAKSLSLKCEYDAGQGKTTAYVRGGKMRIEGAWEGQKNYAAVIKDDKLYSWDSEKKEGVVIPLKTGEGEKTTSEDIIGNLETQKNYCKVAVFGDDIFNPPTDIKFQDLSGFLDQP